MTYYTLGALITFWLTLRVAEDDNGPVKWVAITAMSFYWPIVWMIVIMMQLTKGR